MSGAVRDSMTFQLAQFPAKFQEHIRNVVGEAALALMSDAINQEPTPPLWHGHLRGSAVPLVEGVAIAGYAGEDASLKESGKITAAVVFDVPYARYQHEGQEPGPGVIHPRSDKLVHLQPGLHSVQAGDTGGLFLSLKLNRNRQRYATIVTNGIKRFLKS